MPETAPHPQPTGDSRLALDAVAAQAVPVSGLVLGVLLIALAAAHARVLPAPYALPMAGVSAVSGVVLLAFADFTRRRPRPGAAHGRLFAVVAVLTLNAALVMLATGEPRQTTNFILIQLGIGSLMLSLRWFTAASALVAATWLGVAIVFAGAEGWTHFFFAFWAGAALSGILFYFRRQTQLRLAAYRAAEARRIDEAQASNQAMFQALVEQAHIGIAILGKNGVCEYVNPKTASILGYAPEEIVGRPMVDFAYAADRDLALRNIDRRLDGEVTSLQYQARAVRKDGSVVDLEIFGTRAQFRGEPAIISSVVDVTERRRFERELAENERRLSTLLGNLPGIAYRCRNDRDWSMEFVSDGVLAMTGYPPADFLPPGARSYNDCIHPDDRERVWREVQATLDAGQSFTLAYRLIHRGGGVRWVWEQGTAVRDATGAIVALEGFIADVTAREQAERNLARSEHRLRLALEAGNVGIWDMNLATGHMAWTDTLAALIGLPPAPLEGDIASLQSRVLPADWPRLQAAFEATMAGGETFEGEFRVMVAGEERWLAVGGRRVRDEETAVPGRLMGWLQDVTPQKRFVAALEAAKREAEEANRLKSAILANMSHEIRTPMTAILGFADLLVRKLAGSPHQQDAETIKAGGKRLLALLNNVLDLARIEAGKADVRRRAHPAREAVDRVAALFSVLAERKGLRLAIDVAPGLYVVGDLQAEEQVLTNLVGNAVKFTDAGEVRLRVYPSPSEDAVCFEVADTGVGIAEDFLPHVFEEFRQESEGLGRQYEGSGLGLTIAKRLVDALGGTISVTSRKNEGSVFRVSLPAAPAPAENPVAPGGEVAPGSAAGPPTLLVEDDDAVGRLVTRLLAPSRKLVWARTADEALACAAADRFALLLVDINLKGSDMAGDALLAALRRIPGYDGVPAVAVTAYAMPGDRERLLAAGFDAYLAKPFDTATLLTTLRETAATKGTR